MKVLMNKAIEAWEEARLRGFKYSDLKSKSQINRLYKGEIGLNALATLMDSIGYTVQVDIVKKGQQKFESDQVYQLLLDYYKHKEGIKTMPNCDQILLRALIG